MPRLILVVLLLTPAVAQATTSQLICMTNISPLHARGHWKVMIAADKNRIARLSARGKVEVKYVHGALVCAYWVGNTPRIDVPAGLWFWRWKQSKR